MRRLCKCVMLVCATAACCGIAVQARAQAPASAPRDSEAVLTASKNFLAAARRGDESALRKMWTTDGEFVDASGKVVTAAELIQQLAGAKVEGGSADGLVAESTLRFVTPDVAIVDGITDRVCEFDGSILNRRFTSVWVKREGKWLLNSLREAATEASPINEHLKPLEWLVGEWVGTTEDSSVLVSSRWCDGGQFMLREFVVAREGRGTISGTQRIGWDAAGKKIKSWTFDSQGGAGDENWRRDGNRWIVDTVDVTADGQKGKTSAIYTPGDDQHFTWEVAGADIGGVKLTPTRIEFRRAADDK